jgi:hypothetical protein
MPSASSLARAAIDPCVSGCDNRAVTEAEFLDRIDQHIALTREHIAVANGHMERGNAHMERGNALMERVEEGMRLNREERAEIREFMRELTLRHERSTQAVVRTLVEMQDELKAHRGSLLAIHDRLQPPPAD